MQVESRPPIQANGLHADAGPSGQYSVNSFKPLISKLLGRPDSFTPSDLRLALFHLIHGEVSQAQTGSFLASLRATEVWCKPGMVHVLVEVMRDLSGNVRLAGEGNICDWTMTGDSALSVLNVALPAAIVAAGAGCRVVKTGNASSPWPSTPSSGDVLSGLAVPTKTLPPFSLTQVASSRHVPFLHIYTPGYSPQLAAIAPLRRELGFPTIFHSVSSLISPTKRDYLVIGVHEKSLGMVFAEGCRVLGAKRAWVVYGENGLDAISPEGSTTVWELEGQREIVERTINPDTFGANSFPLASLQLPEEVAANYQTHAKIISAMLSPRRRRTSSATAPSAELSQIFELPPDEYANRVTVSLTHIEEWVCMNAAALIYVSGKAASEKEAMDAARRSVREGRAYHALEALRDAAALAVDVDEVEQAD